MNYTNPQTGIKPRYHYLDNLKVALTVLVIFHHGGIAYGDGGGWAYTPSNPDEFMPWIWHFFSTNAAFFMGLFFMISGYFVPRSYDLQGFGTFIGKKAMRLLIPTAVITLLFSLGSHQLEVGHTWFLESLFLFCLIYALIRLIFKTLTINTIPTFLLMTITASAMGIGSYFIRQASPQDNWIWLLGIIKIEPAHYLQYIMMFALGVTAGHSDGFSKMTGRTGFTALAIGIVLCIFNYLRADNAIGAFIYQWFGIFESFLCVFLCYGLIWLFRQYFSETGKFSSWCATQAFGAYIVHLPLMLIFQNIFDGLWIGAFCKFMFISVITTVASFVLTWLLRLIPGVKKVL
ncbi:MAG: acyltransferase [Bacteroidaceae bacterium]|nr:acyltransferase [Bacteroidaceae bacterium]